MHVFTLPCLFFYVELVTFYIIQYKNIVCPNIVLYFNAFIYS